VLLLASNWGVPAENASERSYTFGTPTQSAFAGSYTALAAPLRVLLELLEAAAQ
jgi:hypothetical protein